MHLLLLAIGLMFLLSHASAAEFPPADHAGGDLILADGDVIWGTHQNVGRFHIPAGAVVKVQAYHPDEAGTGTVVVYADHVEILGNLNATGAGYSGGSGGGGGRACMDPAVGVPGVGGAIPYEKTGMRGEDGRTIETPPLYNGGIPGNGGKGDGPGGGSMNSADSFISEASHGAYAHTYGPQEEMRIGSGGGGNSGRSGLCFTEPSSRRGGSGGDAGGRGGGLIILHAMSTFLLGEGAVIEANGAIGGLGEAASGVNGGNGASALEVNPLGSSASLGGRGSGGGIEFDFAAATEISVARTAYIRTYGGGDRPNGGVVRIKGPSRGTHVRPSQVRARNLFDVSPVLEFPPTDHAGGDLLLQEGYVIWGTHQNVGRFHIPAGDEVKVRAYLPDEEGSGTVVVHADRVEIIGRLNATGVGYSGGSGGGGGAGARGGQSGGQAGQVPYEHDGMRGENGQRADYESPGVGGNGGAGHGNGGVGGIKNPSGWQPTPPGNGVYSYEPSTELSLGSGGGGAAGYNGGRTSMGPIGVFWTGKGGDGGSAGGRGGGLISIHASSALILGQSAIIEADGGLGGSGYRGSPAQLLGNAGGQGGWGGSAAIAYPGLPYDWLLPAGAGSGGGIALEFPTAGEVVVPRTAIVRSLGGGAELSNGGLIRINAPVQGYFRPQQLSALYVYDLSPVPTAEYWLFD